MARFRLIRIRTNPVTDSPSPAPSTASCSTDEVTVDGFLLRWAERDPDRVAIVTPTRRYSYRDLTEAVASYVRALNELGAGRGDRVAVVLEPCFEAAALLCACSRLGVVWTPISPENPSARVATVVSAVQALAMVGTEATLFFLIGEYAASWDRVLSGDLPTGAFVEEVVRFEAPLWRTFRFARRATEIDPSIAIPRYSTVELALREANRNQPTIDKPEEWGPSKGRGVGATFGFGRHVCLGKVLALAELDETAAPLRQTGSRASSIRQRAPMGTSTFRRPDAIQVALRPMPA